MFANLPHVVTRVDEVRTHVLDLRHRSRVVGLVPTMGALHEGHLSLVAASVDQCDATVVSIFVNPTQFGADDDFERYPRDLESDLAALRPYGVDLVFAPEINQMYQAGHRTEVGVGGIGRLYEGRCRPGHFPGVTTIVSKLFNLIPADVCFFGQKDFQQTVVIRRMVEDLNIPITIFVCPTIRDEDGLALSSRNAFLHPDQRRLALGLSRSLRLAGELVQHGERDAAVIIGRMRCEIQADGNVHIDYVALADAETLEPVQSVDRRVVALLATRIGDVRLIDNQIFEPSEG